MRTAWKTLFCSGAVAMFAAGCQTQTPPTAANPPSAASQSEGDSLNPEGDHKDDHGESDVEIAMGKLSAEDRKEAEAQKYCAVLGTSLLGSMGTPLKLDIKGEPVFLCCSGCKSKALENPEATLASVAKMKAENRSGRD